MEIAPGSTDAQWQALDLTTEEGWLVAIDAFKHRIDDRFLGPAGDLLRLGKRTGFAALALDCLLVEALQQFKDGLDETPDGDGPRLFEEFLTTGAFLGVFTSDTARLFRKTIRNGLLHMAQTKGSSLVRRGKNDPIVATTSDGKGIVVNAVLFHEQLKIAFEAYVADLKKPGSTLRPAFRAKMEFIAGKNRS